MALANTTRRISKATTGSKILAQPLSPSNKGTRPPTSAPMAAQRRQTPPRATSRRSARDKAGMLPQCGGRAGQAPLDEKALGALVSAPGAEPVTVWGCTFGPTRALGEG